LAEELLAKESIGLPDIVRILGERPFDEAKCKRILARDARKTN